MDYQNMLKQVGWIFLAGCVGIGGAIAGMEDFSPKTLTTGVIVSLFYTAVRIGVQTYNGWHKVGVALLIGALSFSALGCQALGTPGSHSKNNFTLKERDGQGYKLDINWKVSGEAVSDMMVSYQGEGAEPWILDIGGAADIKSPQSVIMAEKLGELAVKAPDALPSLLAEARPLIEAMRPEEAPSMLPQILTMLAEKFLAGL